MTLAISQSTQLASGSNVTTAAVNGSAPSKLDPVTIGTATTGSLGSIASNELEHSTVDLATELTDMISAQRSYEANSKVIPASSDLLKAVDQLSG